MEAEEVEVEVDTEEDVEVIITEAFQTEQKVSPMETFMARSDRVKAKVRGRSGS